MVGAYMVLYQARTAGCTKSDDEPIPRVLSISSVPPTCVTRSRILRRPKPPAPQPAEPSGACHAEPASVNAHRPRDPRCGLWHRTAGVGANRGTCYSSSEPTIWLRISPFGHTLVGSLM